MQISMDKYKTSELGQALKKVYKGSISIKDSIELVKNEISAVFSSEVNIEGNENYSGFFGEVIGKCPLCSGEVAKGKYGFSCKNYKEGCKFRINAAICKKTLSVNTAKQLLEQGKTEKLSGFISKQGKSFDAFLKLENGKTIFEF